MAVVGFASPKTCGQSAKARFAVMTMPAAVAGPSIADKEVNYVAGAVHDYGTKFLVTAGLLNLLAIADAFEIARGRKS